MPLAWTVALAMAAASASDADCAFTLRADLDAAPRIVFPRLHQPDELQWLGPFELVERGPEHRSGIGSVRRVQVLWIVVEETITEFDPPRRVGYRVTRSRSIANHRARMTLRETADGGSRLVWSVRFDSKRRLEEAHCRRTERYLKRALQRLGRQVRRDAR